MAKTNDWMLAPVGPRHQKFSRGARIISVAFRADWPGGHSLYDHGRGHVVASRNFPELERCAVELVDYVEQHFPNASNQLFLEIGTVTQHWEIQVRFATWTRAYASVLSAIGIRPAQPRDVDSRLTRSMESIDRHALNLPFREAEIAREAGLSLAQFHRLFVRQFSKTPRERFEERREQAAVTLVEQSLRPLKVISADLGFSSPAHFSRWFAKRLKTSPRARRSQT